MGCAKTCARVDDFAQPRTAFRSFVARDVRLPGKDLGTPEVYAFGTPYLHIYDSLRAKDEEFFRRNNLLGLVARNATIKTAPERFQDIPGQAVANFDLVLCFDSRVFYLVVEGTLSRTCRIRCSRLPAPVVP